MYIIESLLISPPAFDFLPRDATRRVLKSMTFSRVHATLQPALSVRRLVGPHFTFLWFYFFDLTAHAQMV